MKTYHSLRNQLGFNQDLPFTPDWSAAADFLMLIADHCLEHKPGSILECSSGLSTLILARCCQINQYGKVISLENGTEFAAKTRQQLEEFQLQDYASVIDAPLIEQTINGKIYSWYSLESLNIETIEMLVIDGPPGFLQKQARYPALPLLADYFSESTTVFLDDAARDDEQFIIRSWQQQFPQLQHHYINNERGCSILTSVSQADEL